MPTLGEVRAVGKPRQSEATTLATSGCWGAKYFIPIPHSPPSPETVRSKTDVILVPLLRSDFINEFLGFFEGLPGVAIAQKLRKFCTVPIRIDIRYIVR